MLSVGGACPGLVASNPGLQKIILGAFGLPFGLMMTLFSGAELFTGNTALVTMAMLEGKANMNQLIKSWRLRRHHRAPCAAALARAALARAALAGDDPSERCTRAAAPRCLGLLRPLSWLSGLLRPTKTAPDHPTVMSFFL